MFRSWVPSRYRVGESLSGHPSAAGGGGVGVGEGGPLHHHLTPSPLLLSAPPLSYTKQSTGSENRRLSCKVGCRYGSLNVRGSKNKFNKHHGRIKLKVSMFGKASLCSHNQSD